MEGEWGVDERMSVEREERKSEKNGRAMRKEVNGREERRQVEKLKPHNIINNVARCELH